MFDNKLIKFYNDFGKNLLYFLNIIDLIIVYFELGYTLGSIIRTNKCNKYSMASDSDLNKKVEDKFLCFLLGKSAFHEKHKIISFNKYFKELYQLYIDYLEESQKYDKIKHFIDIIVSKNYFEKNEFNLIKHDDINENIDNRQLENLISKPF